MAGAKPAAVAGAIGAAAATPVATAATGATGATSATAASSFVSLPPLKKPVAKNANVMPNAAPATNHAKRPILAFASRLAPAAGGCVSCPPTGCARCMRSATDADIGGIDDIGGIGGIDERCMGIGVD